VKFRGSNLTVSVVVVASSSSSSLLKGFLMTTLLAISLILSKPLLIEFRKDRFVGMTVVGDDVDVGRDSSSQMCERLSQAANIDLK
jgi:hypothetical protein